VKSIRRSVTLLLVLMQSVVFQGQQKEGVENEFKLSLSVHRNVSAAPPTFLALVVRMTNTSQHMIYESACSAFGALYKVSVKYNGIALPESEAVTKRREKMEAGEANGGSCDGSNPGEKLKPGESWDDTKYYNAVNPGTYEFSVERKTFPRDPKDSVIVKSNTVMVIMPDPEKPD
jgi:hypothetical protein